MAARERSLVLGVVLVIRSRNDRSYIKTSQSVTAQSKVTCYDSVGLLAVLFCLGTQLLYNDPVQFHSATVEAETDLLSMEY